MGDAKMEIPSYDFGTTAGEKRMNKTPLRSEET